MNKACPKIIGKNLTVAYGDYVCCSMPILPLIRVMSLSLWEPAAAVKAACCGY